MTLVERLLTRFLRVHDAVYQKTNGRIGRRLPGFAPALLLHTVGAKSGQPRTTSLSYSNDGNDYLIVASKGGDPRAPGWYFNLKKQPNVEINVGPRRFPVTAHIVMPTDPDYGRLWDIVNRNNRNVYREYQERTRRPIPVVVLSPR
ncbi:MAG: nitroreductase family deazaflavin-dependent oxidoreductase [Mycobacterium sp.]|nr:nitroreductase family deazaflavin-dependent oxidoreductase [Mycobacterium sp.]